MKRPGTDELKKFDVYYPDDTDFAAHARLLQSKWRVKKGYEKNSKKRSNYGNFIETAFATSEKVNFITERIRSLVVSKMDEVNKAGGLISPPRIWNNMLSSQPLCFNLFGELSFDLELATALLRELFPNKLYEVTNIDFEYSNRRGLPDHSAFDVFVEYLNSEKRCFFGIEVKYQERMREEAPSKAAQIFQNHKEEYNRLTRECGFFRPEAFGRLPHAPFAQIWRDHLLAYNMTDGYDDGSFVFLYPFDNRECHKVVSEYKAFLVSDNVNQTKFHVLDLAAVMRTLHRIHETDWTRELLDRYLGE